MILAIRFVLTRCNQNSNEWLQIGKLNLSILLFCGPEFRNIPLGESLSVIYGLKMASWLHEKNIYNDRRCKAIVRIEANTVAIGALNKDDESTKLL